MVMSGMMRCHNPYRRKIDSISQLDSEILLSLYLIMVDNLIVL